jgi:hypothetical protein
VRVWTVSVTIADADRGDTMYPAPDSITYLARFQAEERAAQAEARRHARELRAAPRVTDDTSPRPRRRWAWSLRPWFARPVS